MGYKPTNAAVAFSWMRKKWGAQALYRSGLSSEESARADRRRFRSHILRHKVPHTLNERVKGLVEDPSLGGGMPLRKFLVRLK